MYWGDDMIASITRPGRPLAPSVSERKQADTHLSTVLSTTPWLDKRKIQQGKKKPSAHCFILLILSRYFIRRHTMLRGKPTPLHYSLESRWLLALNVFRQTEDGRDADSTVQPIVWHLESLSALLWHVFFRVTDKCSVFVKRTIIDRKGSHVKTLQLKGIHLISTE